MMNMMRYPNCRLPGGESMGSYGAKKQKQKLQKVKMVRTVHAILQYDFNEVLQLSAQPYFLLVCDIMHSYVLGSYCI